MTAEEVCEIFGDRVDIVIDGKAGGNLASTVAAVWGWGVEILRQGPIEIPQDERVTRDQILRGRLTLLQPARGYRFSIDALLLADFAATIVSTSLSSISSRSEQVRGADLGSGCGVVALALWSLLARPGLDLKPSPDTRPHQATPDLQPPPAQPGREATPDLQPPPAQPGREATPDLQPRLEMGRPCPAYLETFEIQPKLAELARLNVGLNSADASVEVVERDVREISRRQASHQLHFAVSNPPFRPAGKGRASPDVQKETALCDRSLSPEELARAFANVLVPGGWAIAIYPAGRLSEVFSAFRHAGLRIERVRAAHPTADRPARRVLVAATRSKTKKALTVEPPLIMHTEEGTDTDELRRIVGEEPSAQNPIRP
jgi:tRNA1(Val) A37 N6-methylase TrmN6